MTANEPGSHTHRGGIRPPAGEAHVDFMLGRAESLARAIYEKAFPDGKGFSRFIASSLWRAFQDPSFADARPPESIEMRSIAYFE